VPSASPAYDASYPDVCLTAVLSPSELQDQFLTDIQTSSGQICCLDLWYINVLKHLKWCLDTVSTVDMILGQLQPPPILTTTSYC
jgi:hypothetical protein